MVIELEGGLGDEAVSDIRERIERSGWRTRRNGPATLVATAVPGAGPPPSMPGVRQVREAPLPLVTRAPAWPGTEVTITDGTSVGGETLLVAAGPCSVEGRGMLLATARHTRQAGARLLRGGAFKPRTSPYAFQGLGREGLELLDEARRTVGMPVITEVMDTRDVELVAAHADVLQVGARNMQNFALLSELGRVRRPVLLKRGLSATLAELLAAAEYILAQGNPDVILCERGIRTFEPSTRNTLDIAAIPVLKLESHLPVLVDPSHAAGRADLVAPLACAAVAAGADGIIVEVHPDPASAWSDGPQSLDFPAFDALMTRLGPCARAAGRRLEAPEPPLQVAR